MYLGDGLTIEGWNVLLYHLPAPDPATLLVLTTTPAPLLVLTPILAKSFAESTQLSNQTELLTSLFSHSNIEDAPVRARAARSTAMNQDLPALMVASCLTALTVLCDCTVSMLYKVYEIP